jgi:hypothetical protein
MRFLVWGYLLYRMARGETQNNRVIALGNAESTSPEGGKFFFGLCWMYQRRFGVPRMVEEGAS